VIGGNGKAFKELGGLCISGTLVYRWPAVIADRSTTSVLRRVRRRAGLIASLDIGDAPNFRGDCLEFMS
jgi:hypothetical protein